MNDKNIGFFKLVADDERKRMIGALLVTDELGKPEEFRVTYPIKPTMLQRQLYGGSLLPHVGVELCGTPLHAALRSKPLLVVVSHLDFLGLSHTVSSPVVYLEKAGATLVLKDGSSARRNHQDEIQSESGRFDPLRVMYPIDYSPEQRSFAALIVQEFFNVFDLLEPFSRIDVAIRVLQEQDEKFR